MEFTPLDINGAFLVDATRVEDERGYFARGWCQHEFAQHDLRAEMCQLNIGYSTKRGTLRGLHYQDAPHQEAKFVRCTRGAIYDVVVDLRRDSSTFGRWYGTELQATGRRMLYVPEGCAHGYQTLVDDTEIYYLTSVPYVATAARGVRYDDPVLQISWPLQVTAISVADTSWPSLRP